MPDSGVHEHLKTAKKLHFQGYTEDAMEEYKLVLKLDPQNQEALKALSILRGEDPRKSFTDGDEEERRVKTNFFVNQAKSSSNSVIKAGVFKTIVLALSVGTIYGLYVIVNYALSYDNIKARDNVEITFEKPRIKEDEGLVNIEIVNLNPAPIKQLVVGYRIADAGDTTLKEGSVKLAGQVPAGDKRTFSDISLGSVKGIPAKLSPRLDALQYGPKPKLKDKYAARFIKAAALKDKDALYEYEELAQDAEDFAPAYIGAGRSFAARGKMDEALAQYKKAIELDPENANAHYYSGVAWFYKENREEAKKELDKAMQLAPDDPEIAWNQKYLLSMKEAPKHSTEQNRGKGKKNRSK